MASAAKPSKSFWHALKRPLFCVAPMADVTDAAFRRLISDLAKPSVMWTEFVSCEALCRDESSKQRMMPLLQFLPQEKPLVVQLFGSKPDQFYQSAQMVAQMGFDGIDINMGCPKTNVTDQTSGSALINHPQLAQQIIRECKRGAQGLPVSVKTRIGFHKIDYKDWILRLLEMEPEVLTVHGRTRDEMSKVPAHWDAIGEIVQLARSQKSKALILGNGDVQNLVDARQRVECYGVDGVMIGRALFGNPWLFDGHVDTSHIPLEEKLLVMKQHTKYFDEMLWRHGAANIARLKKFFRCYLKGFPHSKYVRERFAATKTPQEIYALIDEYLERIASEEASSQHPSPTLQQLADEATVAISIAQQGP